jgi:hypothetical protein
VSTGHPRNRGKGGGGGVIFLVPFYASVIAMDTATQYSISCGFSDRYQTLPFQAH